MGLTLDEITDYELLKNIIDHFELQGCTDFSCLDVIRFLRIRKDLVNINKDVVRKGNT